MRMHAGPLAGLVALATIGSAAHATTVVPVTVEDLARRSDAVVVATPRAAHSTWIGRHIVTDYDLEVQTSVRGTLPAGSHLTLRLAGGIVGRIGQQIPGVVAPAVGTAYVFFVQRATDVPDVCYATHLTASVLTMAVAPTGEVTVLPAAEGMIAPRATPTTGLTPVTTMRHAGIPLATLTATLRSVH